MNLVSRLFHACGHRLWLGILAGMASGASSAGLVALISQSISRGLGPAPGEVIGAFFGLCAAAMVSNSISVTLMTQITQELLLQMRLSLSHNLIKVPLHKLDELGKADILTILTQDVGRFIRAAQIVPGCFVFAVTITVCLAYMSWLSWQLFLFCTTFMVLGIALYSWLERWPLTGLGDARDLTDHLHRAFNSLIEGNKQLKLNARYADFFLNSVLAPVARQVRSKLTRTLTLYGWISNAGGVLFYVLIGLVALVMPALFAVPFEARLGSVLLLLYLINPISALMAMLPELRDAAISLQRLQQLDANLANDHEQAHGADPFSNTVALNISAHNLTYCFEEVPGEPSFTVGPINLSIQQGELVFLVGGNGSGKTTLAMLLLGLLEPQRGHLELNSTVVNASNIAHYRERYCAVFADFHLFEQLLPGRDEQALKQANDYLRQFEMDHKVCIKNGRYSTLKLSAGQKRRLALISTYLEDRAVYVFDEWTADQDPTFREVFYSQLLPDMKRRGKTVIVITHDDRYFDRADRLIHMDMGQLRQETPSTSTSSSCDEMNRAFSNE